MAALSLPEALRHGTDAAEEDLAGLVAGLETVKVLTDRLQRRLAAVRSMLTRLSEPPATFMDPDTDPSVGGGHTD